MDDNMPFDMRVAEAKAMQARMAAALQGRWQGSGQHEHESEQERLTEAARREWKATGLPTYAYQALCRWSFRKLRGRDQSGPLIATVDEVLALPNDVLLDVYNFGRHGLRHLREWECRRRPDDAQEPAPL